MPTYDTITVFPAISGRGIVYPSMTWDEVSVSGLGGEVSSYPVVDDDVEISVSNLAGVVTVYVGDEGIPAGVLQAEDGQPIQAAENGAYLEVDV